MTKFSEEIIGKIKGERIAPVPRWHFLFRGYAFWIMFVVSVLLGSLSFSVIVHMARFSDLDIWSHFQGNIVTSAIMTLPYFWFLSLGIFAIIAYFNWRFTRRGYQYRRRWIVLGSVLLSVFIGSVFHAMGMGKGLDSLMTNVMPFYDQSKHKARQELWLRPESGLLIGKIISVDEINEELMVIDENGNKWSVDDRGVAWENEKLEKKGKIVKVIGKKDSERRFSAKEIRRCGDCQHDEDKDNENDDDKNSNETRKELKDEESDE